MIELAGLNTKNKGAQLMLEAIREHYISNGRAVEFAADSTFGSDFDLGENRLHHMLRARRPGRSWLVAHVSSRTLRKKLGLAIETDARALLDASGFAFGSPHPDQRLERFASLVLRYGRAGKPVVMLPQAFGRFDSESSRRAFRLVSKVATRIYARDPVSLANAEQALGGPNPVLRQAPDITLALKPLPEEMIGELDRACIVPNVRMHTEAPDADSRAAYLPFLAAAVRAVESTGSQAVLLIHDRGDEALCDALDRLLGNPLQRIEHADPIRLKQEIGRSRLVIGSRFHAIVSAISQGVPVVATSWSHKYEMLLAEFGCADSLFAPTDVDIDSLSERIRNLMGPRSAGERLALKSRAESLRGELAAMWADVDEAFDG